MRESALLSFFVTLMMMTLLHQHPVSSQHVFHESQYVLETAEVFDDGFSIRVTQKPDVNNHVTSIQLQFREPEQPWDVVNVGAKVSWSGETPVTLAHRGLRSRTQYDVRAVLHCTGGETHETSAVVVTTFCKGISENDVSINLTETSMSLDWPVERDVGCTVDEYKYRINKFLFGDSPARIYFLPLVIRYLNPDKEYKLQIVSTDGHVSINKTVTTLRHEFDESKLVKRGNKQYFFYPYSMTWPRANQYCKSYGMELVTIESAEENEFVTQEGLKVASHVIYWLGATRESVDGKWTWSSTGRDVTFTSWREDEPNNQTGNEKCVLLTAYDITYHNWSDQNCDDTEVRFVCEKV